MRYYVMKSDATSPSGWRRIGAADTLREAAKLSEVGSEIWHEKRYREYQDKIIDQTFQI